MGKCEDGIRPGQTIDLVGTVYRGCVLYIILCDFTAKCMHNGTTSNRKSLHTLYQSNNMELLCTTLVICIGKVWNLHVYQIAQTISYAASFNKRDHTRDFRHMHNSGNRWSGKLGHGKRCTWPGSSQHQYT